MDAEQADPNGSSEIRTSVDRELRVTHSLPGTPPLRDSRNTQHSSRPVYAVKWFRGSDSQRTPTEQLPEPPKPWFRGEPPQQKPRGPLIIEQEEQENESHQPRYICVVTFWVALVLLATILAIIYTIVKVADDDCDHGTALPGSVTAPDDTDALQGFALVWSFLPYVVALAGAGFMFYRQTMWPMQIMMMTGLIVCLNEAVVKQIVSQSRPDGSCLHSNGMPSSHSELAAGTWVYFILELVLKEQILTEPRRRCWSQPATRTKWKAIWLSIITLICVPIPFSRVSLEDHSWSQIGVGALIGSAIAVGWFFMMNKWAYNHLDRIADLLQGCPGGLLYHFTNDYYPIPENPTSNQNTCRQRLLESDADTSSDSGLAVQDATANHSVV